MNRQPTDPTTPTPGVTRNATGTYSKVQTPGLADAPVRVGRLAEEEGGEAGLPGDAEAAEVERRRGLNRARQQRFRDNRKARKEGKSPPNRVTRPDAEAEGKTPLGVASRAAVAPDADIPPSAPGRKRVLAVSDAPRQHDPARRILAHFAAAVGRPAVPKEAAVVAVKDLLASGVPAPTLMRASDAYGAFARVCGTPPMGAEDFFAEGGTWRQFANGPHRRPDSPPRGAA